MKKPFELPLIELELEVGAYLIPCMVPLNFNEDGSAYVSMGNGDRYSTAGGVSYMTCPIDKSHIHPHPNLGEGFYIYKGRPIWRYNTR